MGGAGDGFPSQNLGPGRAPGVGSAPASGPVQTPGRNNLLWAVYGEQIKPTWKHGWEEMENETQAWIGRPEAVYFVQLCPEIA